MVWLGIGTMFFNLFQLYGHGWQMNKALNTWYNPDLASVMFLFVPIALYYFYFISARDLATWTTWLGGVDGLCHRNGADGGVVCGRHSNCHSKIVGK